MAPFELSFSSILRTGTIVCAYEKRTAHASGVDIHGNAPSLLMWKPALESHCADTEPLIHPHPFCEARKSLLSHERGNGGSQALLESASPRSQYKLHVAI